MSDDLLLVRLLAVSGASDVRELLRQGAALVTVPVEVLDADSAVRARSVVATRDVEIAMLDLATAGADVGAFVTAARAARQPPLIILVAANRDMARQQAAAGAVGDAIVVRPATADHARALIERCIRLRQARRVLVVDDSSTMRAIVRKVLSGSRFRLEVADAEEGIEALKHIGSGKFDVVFLDYNMPGFNGIETLSEIKRQYPRVEVVIMTANRDEALADRARDAGAAAFLKKPFYPADIDAILHSVFGLWGGK
jgi:CheY-like chemotaxis protein